MRSILALMMATLAVLSIALAPGGMAPPSTVTYIGGGTVVVKQQSGEALADDGALVCAAASGLSVGGGCIPFGAYDAVKVADATQGGNVAFQVCIDNNGDGLCTEKVGQACDDDQFFSHSDQGQFFNPLGPLPQGFRTGCAGGAWQGYVVFLCEGVHLARGASVSGAGGHAHAATTGSITSTIKGTGYGDFCQPHGVQAKAYVVA